MTTETYDHLQQSRGRLLTALGNARAKLLEQDLLIQDLKDDSDTMRRAIGELRSQVVYWKTRCMALELLGPAFVEQVNEPCNKETAG